MLKNKLNQHYTTMIEVIFILKKKVSLETNFNIKFSKKYPVHFEKEELLLEKHILYSFKPDKNNNNIEKMLEEKAKNLKRQYQAFSVEYGFLEKKIKQ